MTFHITDALAIERTVVISATIVLFGLFSVGSLWLWRRLATGRSPAGLKETSSSLAELMEQVEVTIHAARTQLENVVSQQAKTVAERQQHSSTGKNITLETGG